MSPAKAAEIVCVVTAGIARPPRATLFAFQYSQRKYGLGISTLRRLVRRLFSVQIDLDGFSAGVFPRAFIYKADLRVAFGCGFESEDFFSRTSDRVRVRGDKLLLRQLNLIRVKIRVPLIAGAGDALELDGKDLTDL